MCTMIWLTINSYEHVVVVVVMHHFNCQEDVYYLVLMK